MSRLLAYPLQTSERDLRVVLLLDSATRSFHSYFLLLCTAGPTHHRMSAPPSTLSIRFMDLFKARVCRVYSRQTSASTRLNDMEQRFPFVVSSDVAGHTQC